MGKGCLNLNSFSLGGLGGQIFFKAILVLEKLPSKQQSSVSSVRSNALPSAHCVLLPTKSWWLP